MGPRDAEFETLEDNWWVQVGLHPRVKRRDFVWVDWVLVGSVDNADAFVECPYPCVLVAGVSKRHAFLVHKEYLGLWLQYAASLKAFIRKQMTQELEIDEMIASTESE